VNSFRQKKNDNRITLFGAFLRKTSLDELPQLINVVKGDMSIVGPRPHPVELNNIQRKKIPRYMTRSIVKPGITGLAQVNGFRGETDTFDKIQRRIAYDLDYIKNWSLLSDFKIIIKTALKVFNDENAY
jgi:putative colanic acid biosynthesis UDP-glucose lipid carrier transferase